MLPKFPVVGRHRPLLHTRADIRAHQALKFASGPRVCFLSFSPVVGGISTYQANNMAYLLDRCHVLFVDESPQYTLARLGRLGAERVLSLQVPLWSAQDEAQPLMLEWLLKHRPTVIAISNVGLLVKFRSLLRLIRRELGTCIVMIHHSGVLNMTPRRLVLELVSSMLAFQVQDMVYVSNFTRRYWEERYPWMRRFPARVVPNGVPIPKEEIVAKGHSPVMKVGFVGRLSPEKDPELFCQVARLAQGQGLPYEFHVHGNGPLEGGLRKRYGTMVQWHGVKDERDAPFQEMGILMITSPVENCPYALLESKSYGVPTVAPPVGGIPEILEDGKDGVLASGRTAGALLDALVKAAALQVQLSRGCLERRERFDIAQVGRIMWEPYLHSDSGCREP